MLLFRSLFPHYILFPPGWYVLLNHPRYSSSRFGKLSLPSECFDWWRLQSSYLRGRKLRHFSVLDQTRKLPRCGNWRLHCTVVGRWEAKTSAWDGWPLWSCWSFRLEQLYLTYLLCWSSFLISLLFRLHQRTYLTGIKVILTSGSRDNTIVNHDVRAADHHVSTLYSHRQEVCGLRWSPDGHQLASGGNDNLLNIWDLNNATPVFSLTAHTAAVKALSWCPFQPNLLASGGGTSDRTIRMWNTVTGACLNVVDTKSQVCQLLWSTNYRELISSHGFSQNQLTVWKYPSMSKVAELTGTNQYERG